MSKQANKTVIGAFLVGAVGLAAAGLIILGGGKFLTKRATFVMYFEGSVKGLSVGAPVVFRGVEIGQVKDIFIRADPKDFSARIPVYVEIDTQRVRAPEDFRKDPTKNFPHLIEKGLRAQLDLQSLVTGKLQVNLDFYSDKKPRLVREDTEYTEIPTISTEFEKIKEKISKLPIDEIFGKLSASLTGIERIVNSPEIVETIGELRLAVADARKLLQDTDDWITPIGSSVHETIGSIKKLVEDTDMQIEPLAKDARSALVEAKKSLRQSRKFLNAEKGRTADMISSIKKMADAIKKAADASRPAIIKAEKAIGNIQSITDANSEDRYMVNNMLKELSSAARSIRIWAEYLERHPEALIRGKGGPTRR